MLQLTQNEKDELVAYCIRLLLLRQELLKPNAVCCDPYLLPVVTSGTNRH